MNIPNEIQSIIEKMAKHLADQGQQSISLNGSCKYRGPNDLKCAVGALLSDEACEGDIEGESVLAFFDGIPRPNRVTAADELNALRGDVPEYPFSRFLDKCQSYHDTSVSNIWVYGSQNSYRGRLTEGTATVEVITADLEHIWRSLN